MAKKRFSGFGEISRAALEATPSIDREVLRKTIDDGVRDVGSVKSIRIERIRPDPHQPRKHFDDARLSELAESIRWKGVLDPIKVQYIREGDYFLLIDGQRRLMAAKLLGLEEVPAIIRDASADERFIQQLIENLQREDLNDVERALALQRLKSVTGYSWQRLADMLGLTKRRVLQLDEITELPKPLQDDIVAGRLSDKHARALGKLSEPLLGSARQAVRERRLTGDQTIRLVDQLNKARGDAADERAVSAAVAEAVRVVVEAPKRPTLVRPTSQPPPDAPAVEQPPMGASVSGAGQLGEIAALASPAPAAASALERLRSLTDALRSWDAAGLRESEMAEARGLLVELGHIVAEVQGRLSGRRNGKR